MSDALLIVAATLGVLLLFGVAGFLSDLLLKRRFPSRHEDAVQRRASQTLRYHRDVGDSTNAGGM
jgi:hypothetical protein